MFKLPFAAHVHHPGTHHGINDILIAGDKISKSPYIDFTYEGMGSSTPQVKSGPRPDGPACPSAAAAESG